MLIGGSRILVTGGCGLVGSTTIDLLLKEHSPERVVILDNLVRGSLENVEDSLKDRRVELVRGDIRNVPLLEGLTVGMDAVIHMATLRITACAAEPREALTVMCDGTFNVVEAARKANVKKVVTASSASVYGLADSFPTREDHHPYNDRTWYGATKVMLEGLLRSYFDMFGLPYVALRYFNIYGPRMDIHGKYTEVLVRWMEKLEAGGQPVIFGDGRQTMDFVDVRDVARSNVLALASDLTDKVYNIASGTETSLAQLLDHLRRVMGREDIQPRYEPARAVNPVPRRLADTALAREELGFSASIGLEEGLRDLVNWWRACRAVAPA
jgi:UDP-glucose 4-epimerase